MAWVRMCGSTKQSEWDALSKSWDVLPTTDKTIPPSGQATWTCLEISPIINDHIIEATMGTFENGEVKIQASIDGNTWNDVLTKTNSEAGGVHKSASLSLYNGNRIYIRCIYTNTATNTRNCAAIYSTGTPILKIAK